MAISIGEYSIALDCGDPSANVNFVSHAHSDHTSGLRKDKKVIASQITKEFIQCRTKRKSIELIENPRDIKLLDAGHILGSKQLYAEPEDLGASIMYTGDYQMQRSLVAEPIELKQADILIIDSTYPERDVVFGDRAEVMSSISEYIVKHLERGIVLFGSYTLGKAQEIIKIANEADVCPVVDQKVHDVNQIYEKHGIRLDYASSYKDESELESVLKGNFMGVTSVNSLQDVAYNLEKAHNKRVYTAVATGFAKVFNMDVDAQFPLSDHADYKQALEYINVCNPKVIYTRGESACAEKFARNLMEDGYDARVFEGGISAHTPLEYDARTARSRQ